jgi:hypothetical protein
MPACHRDPNSRALSGFQTGNMPLHKPSPKAVAAQFRFHIERFYFSIAFPLHNGNTVTACFIISLNYRNAVCSAFPTAA